MQALSAALQEIRETEEDASEPKELKRGEKGAEKKAEEQEELKKEEKEGEMKAGKE